MEIYAHVFYDRSMLSWVTVGTSFSYVAISKWIIFFFLFFLVRRIQFQFLICFSWLNNGSLQTQGQVIHRNPAWYLHFVIEQNNPPLFYFSWSSIKNDSFLVTLTQPGTKILLLSFGSYYEIGSKVNPLQKHRQLKLTYTTVMYIKTARAWMSCA